jgi:hypothetical protein
MGEIPTVQERFQAVLKRRLQLQIATHPPLFPWEDQLIEYPEFVEESSIALVPNWGWLAQRSQLELPVILPDKVFQHLLDKCQFLLASTLPLGAKLVKALESLFPEDPQEINDLAGLVLRSTYRSTSTLATSSNIESDYSTLLPRQQMVLSLMAAKQLLETLTLPISSHNPLVERQWLTDVGILNIKIESKSCNQNQGMRMLTIQSNLPTYGILRLRGSDAQLKVTSTGTGKVTLEFICEQHCQDYTLEVALSELGEQPLVLKIMLDKN